MLGSTDESNTIYIFRARKSEKTMLECVAATRKKNWMDLGGKEIFSISLMKCRGMDCVSGSLEVGKPFCILCKLRRLDQGCSILGLYH